MQQGYWDIHNHILPGVDDGAGCMEETLLMTEREHQMGIRNIIFTPHWRKGMFEVSQKEKEQVFLDAVYQLHQYFTDMQFYLGCEYYVSSKDPCQDLRSYCISGSDSILIEFAPGQSFQKICSTVSTLRGQGIQPMLAHVERYLCLREDPERIRELKQLGARIQINADSLMGKNGFGISRFARQLVRHRRVDLIASDAHDAETRIQMLGKSIRYVEKSCGEGTAQRIFVRNPQRLLE